MKKLIALLILAGTLAQAQVTNTVNISNSLLGPVTNFFTGTVVDVSGDIVLTGAVFNTSVTNTFSPVNNFTSTVNVGSTTVNNTNTFITTNIIAEGAVNITNVVQYTGTFTQTIVTNLIDQFVGVNVFTPYLADTNVSGTWTIDLKTNAPVAIYEQIGNVTQIVFSVDDTNQIALAEILLLATTNSITWPTNGLTWAAGSEPTPTASEYNRIYFEAWRDYVYAVFVGSNP